MDILIIIKWFKKINGLTTQETKMIKVETRTHFKKRGGTEKPYEYEY